MHCGAPERAEGQEILGRFFCKMSRWRVETGRKLLDYSTINKCRTFPEDGFP